MPEEAPANEKRLPTPEDIDLYCLNCGYNLRGLSGDPRRCPECGYKNPLGDLQIPASLISMQLRRMETAPTVCVGAAGTVLASLVFLTLAPLYSPGSAFDLFLPCCGFSALVAIVVWPIGVGRFRYSCLAKPGWFGVLLKYHLYGLGMCALVAAAASTGPALLHHTAGFLTDGQGLSLILVLVGFLAGLAVIIGVVGRWARRRAKADMDPLQREVAVTLARQRLRKTLRHGARGGLLRTGKPPE